MTRRQELFELAHKLGHRDPAVFSTESGAKFFATCSCGWKSTNRRTLELALEAGINHALGRAQEFERHAHSSGVAFADALARRAS